MRDAYESIRIANEVLTLADQHGVDPALLIQIGDKWVNGECEDDSVNEEYPDISNIMTGLDLEYGNNALLHAFALLIEVGNRNFF